MKIESGDLFTLDEEQYLAIDIIVYEGDKYIFSNEIKNDEPTQNYAIFKQDDDYVEEVTDMKLINLIFPIFNGNIQKLIRETKLAEKYSID